MHELVIRPDWAQQIGRLREHLTESTNIIRWGNGFYRRCRRDAQIDLNVIGSASGVPLQLKMRPSDLYITQIGSGPMGRYGSLTRDLAVSAPKLENAVRALTTGVAHGDEAFGLRSLVVFCVAEALRFDSLAHEIGFALRTTGVAGGAKPMPLDRWWPVVHSWGQACDAVWTGLHPELRRVSLLPSKDRRGDECTRSGRATYDRIGGAALGAARSTAVLKWPAA